MNYYKLIKKVYEKKKDEVDMSKVLDTYDLLEEELLKHIKTPKVSEKKIKEHLKKLSEERQPGINLLITILIDALKLKGVEVKEGENYFGTNLSSDVTIYVDKGNSTTGYGMEEGMIVINKYEDTELPRIDGGVIKIKNFIHKGKTIARGVRVEKDYASINEYRFRKFKLEELKEFKLEVYPELEKKEFPSQMIGMLAEYDLDLKKLREEYLKLFKKAKHYMQRIGLRMNAKTPGLIIRRLEGFAEGGYSDKHNLIYLSLNASYIELELFHEMMHAILDQVYPFSEMKSRYDEVKEVVLGLPREGRIVMIKRTPKYFVEGVTDFLTMHYFMNYDKERKYKKAHLKIVSYYGRKAGPGYYKEVEEIASHIFHLINEEKLSFEQAIRLLLKA